MFGMGMPEIILILAIALIVIGPRKLPDLGRSLGRAMREFRKATNEFKSSLDIDDDLGSVRRGFSELNKDLKSSLESAALGPTASAKSAEKTAPVNDEGREVPAQGADPPSDAGSNAGERQDAGR